MDAANSSNAQLPLYVGTSGWAYAIWKPDFYPKEVASKNFLKYYATQLTAVEVNYTFRRSLSEKAATGWMADVGRELSFRAESEPIHHPHQAACKTLKRRCSDSCPRCNRWPRNWGQCCSSCRPRRRPTLAVLRDFLALLPRNFKAAFEFRHESWFTDEIYQTLHDHNATLCVAETEKLNTPEIRTASYIYFRFRQPSYSAEDLKKLEERIEKCVADGLETYAFFKHEEDPRSPHNAVELLNAVRKKVGAGPSAE